MYIVWLESKVCSAELRQQLGIEANDTLLRRNRLW